MTTAPRRIAALLVSAAVLAIPLATTATSADAATKYKNCKALNSKYEHGVGKKGAKDHVSSGTPVTNFKVSDSLYKANKKLDRDGDHIACEKH